MSIGWEWKRFLPSSISVEKNESNVITMDPQRHQANCFSNVSLGGRNGSPHRHTLALLTNATTLQ